MAETRVVIWICTCPTPGRNMNSLWVTASFVLRVGYKEGEREDLYITEFAVMSQMLLTAG